MKSMEEELSIFDLFGIQRLTASTAAEENDPSQNPSSAIGWRELQSGSLRNDTQSGVGRPREGARLRNRRQLFRNL
ncbi:MAG: hypothetical protein OXF83_07860, partial [Anaerolineaceae bacterium]|nr:hypothetical protein [Anaerolineaceae bacterium]